MLGLLIIVCINVPCLKNKKERKTPQLSTNESLKGNAKRKTGPVVLICISRTLLKNSLQKQKLVSLDELFSK